MSHKSKQATPVKADVESSVEDISTNDTETVKAVLSKDVEPDELIIHESNSSITAPIKTKNTDDKPLKVEPVNNLKAPFTDVLEGFTLLIEDGKALKLSPKTQNHVFYQLAVKDEDNTLHIRMSGNEGGGLHSKLWVSINAITDLLDEQIDKTIKSTLLKPVFQGGSANNCGFMCAVLRSTKIGLLAQSDKSVFVHRLSSDYQVNKTKLLALAK